MKLVDILTQAAELGASDVHITVKKPPVYRLHGMLYPLDHPELKGRLNLFKGFEVKPLSPRQTDDMAREIMSPGQYEKFTNQGELDFSFSLPGIARVRVNVFRQRNSTALVMRLLNTRIPTFKELGLPKILAHLAQKSDGLVLVTGPTGSGKSTTLAAMIDLVNREKRLHILTLEDPIEYLHNHQFSLVNQREIGSDTSSFAVALRAALREDPDVILVGEMRDLETISIAITAAETGHLVLGTLHTSSAAETIDRVIDVFPPGQQQQIRILLSNTLQGIIAQQLIPRSDQPGRVVAMEILVATPAIRNLIREGKTFQILTHLQTGARYGMQTLDMSLRQLYLKELISREEVLHRARDPENLLKILEG